MSDSHSSQSGVTPDQYRVGAAMILALDLQLVRAASATVVVFAPTSTTAVVATTAATLPAESVALTAASGRGSKILTANAAGIADFVSGRSYLLDAESFPALMVDLVDVNSSTAPFTAQIADQLATAAPIGALLLGTRLTYDATADALPRARGYRARWTVTTTEGDVREYVQSFDVVFQPFELQITRRDVESAWPGVGLSLDDDWRVLVAGAVDAIQGELDNEGLEPDRVRNTRPWKRAAVLYICRALVMGKAGSDRTWEKLWERFDTLYQRAVKQALNSRQVWYDATDVDEREDENERPSVHFWDAEYDTDGVLVEAE